MILIVEALTDNVGVTEENIHECVLVNKVDYRRHIFAV